MHISAKGNYGLRAALDLALRYGQGNVQNAAIAARQHIPEPYLVQLLNRLRKGGMVLSTRGPKGGHSLAKHPDKVIVGEVLAILEGPIDLRGEGEGKTGKSPGQDVLQEVWEEVEEAIESILSSITLGDLCRRHQMQRERIVFRI